MIARYTRPGLGAVWTDEARMQAWRQVEVAADAFPSPPDIKEFPVHHFIQP